ncbi:MAG: trypsin-like peptidase domain-containing protein [Planctomycetes bacterium]|nr:trypsin-like peptidase domain-containing protein [Planctomycetota bacterium]
MKRKKCKTCLRVTLIAAITVFGLGQLPSINADEDVLTPEELALVKAAEAHRVGVIERVYGSVVAIYGNARRGGGSGVLFDECGFALTNHHVVAAAGTEGWAGLADGKLYRWKLIGTDPGGDIAIIQLAGKKSFPYSPLADSETVRLGSFAMSMGNPFVLAEDQKPTVSLGIVSGVKRYQPGSGMNMLVYGNCIQVDSSINPGNSGGPLFNLRGEVIGINGRGSFQERGRVNVGLGYAISSNQIKKFIPDLLATKVAQHGTLDALFGDRTAGVVCETMNLDAPIAQQGLQLGDRLVSFEGFQIERANQFTNIISTLPADWPAELVYEREGQRQTIMVRLYSLPYQTSKPKEPKPDEKKPEDKKPDDKKPPAQPVRRGPKVSIANAGEIRDEALNRANANRVIQRWKEFTIEDKSSGDTRTYRIKDDVSRGGKKVGEQETLIATDGRFRVTYTEPANTQTFGFDGKSFWTHDGIGDPEILKTSKALLNFNIYPVATLATLFRENPLADFGEIQLQGSDKSQNQVAYRLKTLDDEGDWFYIWLSVFGTDGRQQVRLLKSGPDLDGDGSSGAVVYGDWRAVEGVKIPFRRALVKGLAEIRQAQYITTHCEVVREVPETAFQMPSKAPKGE